jgi:hypothetical protein
MVKSLRQKITASRVLLENPYAYLNDVGTFSAVIADQPDFAASNSEISASRLKLQDPYAYLDDLGGLSAALAVSAELSVVEKHIAERYAPLVRYKRKGRRYAYADIEAKATELQRMMWQDRNAIWAEGPPSNPIDMLDPAVAFQRIGFNFDISESLGQHFIDDRQVEVAGMIDDSTMEVRISRKFPIHVRHFTAAHELGHALLHDARGLHRDRPLDGSSLPQDPIETEANKFASYFLMPAKLVGQTFVKLFGTDRFILNEDTRFALSRGGFMVLSLSPTLRDISRVLASVGNYNGVRFPSLADQFHVSNEAMAIRIEELGLIVL